MPEKALPFKRLRSETLTYNQKEALKAAQTHQGLPKSPTERELDPKRVKELVERMKAGSFLPCNWATVEYDGALYRMNGQHSSQAILEAGGVLPEEIVVHLDHYEAPDPHGMGSLFRQFDARFSSRSRQDVAGAWQGLARGLDGVPKETVRLGIEGVGWYQRQVEGVPFATGDDLYEVLLKEMYHPFLRWLDNILGLKTPELKQQPVVAAIYATFIASETGSQEFWYPISKDDLNDESDPRYVLAKDLQNTKRKDERTKEVILRLSPAEFYARCVKAWNAFRTGERVRTLNVNPKKITWPPTVAA